MCSPLWCFITSQPFDGEPPIYKYAYTIQMERPNHVVSNRNTSYKFCLVINLLNNWAYDTHYGVSYWHDIYVTCVATTCLAYNVNQEIIWLAMAFSFPDMHVYMYVHAKCKEIHWGSAYKLGSLPNYLYYFINIGKDMHNTMFTKMYRMHYICWLHGNCAYFLC